MLDLLERLRKEWTVIEGAPISFVTACLLAFTICWLAFRQRFAFMKDANVALRDANASLREQLEAIAPAQLAKAIKISAPASGAYVQHEVFVRGTVKPRGSKVQVLVLAGDGLWHPQDRATYDGHNWSARCWIGAPQAPRGSSFQILAIDGDKALNEPVAQVPIDVARSRSLLVYRS